MKSKILIVDDEKAIRESVSLVLSEEGYETEIASNGSEALNLLNDQDYDVLITDLKMPEMDGIELIKKSLKICPQTSVIIITAHASVESAIEALRIGAFDYILKPFDFDDLILKVQRLLKHKELALENQALRKEVDEKLVELILKNRDSKIKVVPGYDGIYGKAVLDEQKKLF